MAIRPACSTASVALSLALAAFASSCGSGQDQPNASTPAATPMPAPAPAAPQAAAAPEPAAPPAAAKGDYPSDFPGDIPRYPGSKVSSSDVAEDEGYAVTIDAPDSVEVVAKFIGDGLTASGWQTTVEVTDEGTMIVAEKEQSSAQALVHEGGQGALVDLIVVRPE